MSYTESWFLAESPKIWMLIITVTAIRFIFSKILLVLWQSLKKISSSKCLTFKKFFFINICKEMNWKMSRYFGKNIFSDNLNWSLLIFILNLLKKEEKVQQWDVNIFKYLLKVPHHFFKFIYSYWYNFSGFS